MILKITQLLNNEFEIKNSDISCIAKTPKKVTFNKDSFISNCIITGKGARLFNEEIKKGITEYLNLATNKEPLCINIPCKIYRYNESTKNVILNAFLKIKYYKNPNIRIELNEIYSNKKNILDKINIFLNKKLNDDLMYDLSYLREIKDLYISYWGINNYLNDNSFYDVNIEKDLDILIDRVSQIEACNFLIYKESNNKKININDLLQHNECLKDLYKKDIVYVIKTTYMNLNEILKNNPKDKYSETRYIH